MKKLKFGKIRIYFKNGKTDVIPKKLWDDYEVNGTLLVVKRCGVWVYLYSLDEIAAVIVDNKVIKK